MNVNITEWCWHVHTEHRLKHDVCCMLLYWPFTIVTLTPLSTELNTDQILWLKSNNSIIMWLVWTFTLYIGCTAGSCLRVATQNTSTTRWVRSRWDSTWNTWNSEWRTHIFANSQARGGSLGRNMGVSRDGVCPSWGQLGEIITLQGNLKFRTFQTKGSSAITHQITNFPSVFSHF